MSKAVMISIQPKWCELIANGKKTVEVRKTRPKLETPFKVYIYCTLQGSNEFFKDTLGGDISKWNKGEWGNKKGKVVGEFVCYDIAEYETEFYPPEKQPVYEAITEWNEENEVYEAVASNCDTYQTNFLKSTCMALEDFREYLGVGEISFYGWHISELVIYAEPKELSEFTKTGALSYEDWLYGIYNGTSASSYEKYLMPFKVTKPPQSWCYVTEI